MLLENSKSVSLRKFDDQLSHTHALPTFDYSYLVGLLSLVTPARH